MNKRLTDQLWDIIEAEQISQQMRREHGQEAEAYCRGLQARLPVDDPKRAQLSDVERALRWR